MIHLLLALLVAFTISWDRSPDPTVLGYRVYSGSASGQYTQIDDVQQSTRFILPNPPRGQTTYCVVTAYAHASIESLPSQEVSYTTPADAPPEQFRLLTIRNVDPNLDWKVEYTTDYYILVVPTRFPEWTEFMDPMLWLCMSNPETRIVLGQWLPCHWRTTRSTEQDFTARFDVAVPATLEAAFIRLIAR
jgi:hypothetical protein